MNDGNDTLADTEGQYRLSVKFAELDALVQHVARFTGRLDLGGPSDDE